VANKLNRSVVIEDDMNGSSQGHNCCLAYFYCSRNTAEPHRSNAQQILACITRQLSSLSPDYLLAPAMLGLYKKMDASGGSMRTPDVEKCCDLIVELAELYSRTTIVVDALDECDLEMRGDLVDALETIVTKSASLVKVFVTSREEGDLRFSLQTHYSIQVTSRENGPDIRTFVNFETDRLVAKNQLLASIRLKSTKQELKALIKADVISKASGM
jgi:hypothetical protein